LEIWEESKKRGYDFDKSKLMEDLYAKYQEPFEPMEVTDAQLEYEFMHLQSKLGEFDKQRVLNDQYFAEEGIESNNIFIIIAGPIMDFEKLKEYEKEHENPFGS